MKTKRYFLCLLVTASALLLLILAGNAWADDGPPPETTWNGGDGNWSDSTKWDNGVPGDGYKAYLDSSGTVTLDVDTGDVLELYIEGMTLDQSDYTLTLDTADGNFLGVDNDGIYNFSGGMIVKPSYEVKIGWSGDGTFNQSGDSVFQFSGAMYLGDQNGSTGVYNMIGGSIEEGADGKGGIVLGEWGGTGYFNQSGESSVDINDLTLARQPDGTGYYFMQGGQLNVDSFISVGELGFGAFDHDNINLENGTGSIVTTDSLYIGGRDVQQGEGEYLLYNGELHVGKVIIGGNNGGTGYFYQGGGEFDTETMDITDTGEYKMNSGNLSGMTITNDGKFSSNWGTVYSDLVNNGYVSLGEEGGTMNIDGSFTQTDTGTLYIRLGGTETQGEDYDWINITNGNATLDGILDVELADEFSPEDGDTFDILTALVIYDQFDFENSILPEGYNWSIAYLNLDGVEGLDTVRLTANAVPIPGALWLLGSGIVGIISIRRKMK